MNMRTASATITSIRRADEKRNTGAEKDTNMSTRHWGFEIRTGHGKKGNCFLDGEEGAIFGYSQRRLEKTWGWWLRVWKTEH